MDQRTCAVCKGALPDGSSARRLYCSEKCRAWASRHLNARSCGVEGCARPHLARGLCGAHYNEAHMADRHKRKVETACAVCGKPIVKTGSTSKSRRPVCSYRCRSILRGHKPRSREVVGPVPRTERAPRPATPPVNQAASSCLALARGAASNLRRGPQRLHATALEPAPVERQRLLVEDSSQSARLRELRSMSATAGHASCAWSPSIATCLVLTTGRPPWITSSPSRGRRSPTIRPRTCAWRIAGATRCVATRGITQRPI